MSQKEPGIEEQVLAALKDTWQEYPSLRPSQLLINVIHPIKPEKFFYIEDSKLIELLNKYKTQN